MKKLNYLTINRPDISCVESVASQFLNIIHPKVYQICSTMKIKDTIGGNLTSWKSKKEDVVARISAEAKNRAVATDM